MKLFYGGEPTTYKIGILNLDGQTAAVDLLSRLQGVRGQDGDQLFKLMGMSSDEQIQSEVKGKVIDIGIIIPVGYSDKLSSAADGNVDSPAVVEFYGSLGNMRYTVAALMASDAVYRQGMEIAQITLPSNISETFVEKKLPINEFEGYVPGLISMAVLMILFSATASIVKENDKKTLIRLKLSRLGAFNFLAGICFVQAGVAVIAIVLTYWTGLGLGYKPVGGFGPVLVVGIISSFSMVAISLVVAAFLDTIFDVLTIGCFPFFILMFFSGSMFPMPKMDIFTVAGHSFAITDILPLSHTANAFNKILNYGAGIEEILFDILMIGLLTVIYFAAGILLYQRRKLSKA